MWHLIESKAHDDGNLRSDQRAGPRDLNETLDLSDIDVLEDLPQDESKQLGAPPLLTGDLTEYTDADKNEDSSNRESINSPNLSNEWDNREWRSLEMGDKDYPTFRITRANNPRSPKRIRVHLTQ